MIGLFGLLLLIVAALVILLQRGSQPANVAARLLLLLILGCGGISMFFLLLGWNWLSVFICLFIVAAGAIVYLVSFRRQPIKPGSGNAGGSSTDEDRVYQQKAPNLGTIDYRSTSIDRSAPGQIGRYRIIAELGSGGMGTVYRAFDPDLDRVVALKLPRFDGAPADVAKRIQRFQREARAAAKIWHPHVCPTYDVGEHNGQPYVVMALIEGQSLAQRLADRGRFEDIAEATALVRQILDGLDAVHTHGILHRDLKPANILLDRSGRAIVTDFGLARTEINPDPITSEGVILGTPAYMAPEQAGRPETVGPPTDLYGVGVVFYQMLTGRLPFEGSALEILAKVLHELPTPPTKYRPEIPARLETAILKALARDPAARFATARQFREALDSDDGTGTERSSESTPTAGKAPPSTDTHFLSGKPAVPIPSKRFWSLPRLLGWTAGGVVLTGGMVVVAFAPYLGRTDDWTAVVCGVPLVTGLAFLIGGSLWFLAELAHVPEGMFWAARKGWMSTVRRALANGVSPDSRNPFGDTLLMWAAATGNADVTKSLLLSGVDIHLRNPFGQSALDIAAAKGHGEIAALLQTQTPREHPPNPEPISIRYLPSDWMLLACALLAASLVQGGMWLSFPDPPVISWQQFHDLAWKGHVKNVVLRDNWLEGSVSSPGHPDVLPLHLRGARFVVVEPLRALPPGVNVIRRITVGPKELPLGPGPFVKATMAGLPVIVAVLAAPALCWLFPTLHRAGLVRRRRRSDAHSLAATPPVPIPAKRFWSSPKLLGWTAASVVVTGGLVLWVAAGAVLVFVVPDYERAFADQGLELRAPMQWTLAAARWGRRYWYVPGLLVPMAVVLSWLLRHRATGSLLGWVWLAALLGVPLLLNLGISLALLLP